MYFKNLVRIISMILACWLCIGLVSCTTEQSEPSTDPPAKEPEQELPEDPQEKPENEDGGATITVNGKYFLAENLDSLKIHGRTSVVGKGISCDFTASGIEFTAYVEGAVKLYLSCTANTYFTVYVDGERLSERYTVTREDSVITLADLDAGDHTVRVLKQTEPMRSLSVLEALEFTGYMKNPPREKDYIEFIGDSITCGYGNLITGSNSDAGNALYADGTQAFAFRTAEALGTDASVISCSGIGLVAGYRNFVEKDFYDKQSYYRSKTEIYDPDRIPDLVVINLGTNDQSHNVSSMQFETAVKELIQLVRGTYGKNVKIVWCHNMMSDGMYSSAKSVIDSMGGERGGLYLCQLTRNTAGGGGHPSMQGHETAAAELVAFIQSKGLI